MIVKIDLEKAYDRLEWHFIEQTLNDIGLPHMMVKMIMQCVSNAFFRLIRNEGSTSRIQQTRGIRQGNPLSPYIFVLCLERPAQRIQNEVEAGRWRMLKASRYGPGIFHLFFCR